MRRDPPRALLLSLLSLAMSACAHGGPAGSLPPSAAPTPIPLPGNVAVSAGARPIPPPPTGSPAIPLMPLVEGKLDVRVVYPPPNAAVAATDSTFILGSVGNGRALLWINGEPVYVYPNGSYLAYLPVPRMAPPRYELVAVLGSDTARLTRAITLPAARPVLAAAGPLVVDSASVTPRGVSMLRDDELVRVAIRAPANASVYVQGNGWQQALVNAATLPARSVDNALPADEAFVRPYLGDGLRWATEIPARYLREATRLIVARGTDTVRFALSVVSVPPHEPNQYVMLLPAPSTSFPMSDTDRVAIARPTPAGTYKWLLFPGAVVQLTGRSGDYLRVRLDAALEVWVPVADAYPLPLGTAGPHPIASNARVVPAAGWADVIIPTGDRPTHLLEWEGSRITLTLYGTQSAMDDIQFFRNDSLVRLITAVSEGSDRVRVTLSLSSVPLGYQIFWERGNIILRLRRAPRVDPRAPLRGRTIAVDPGHPPVGATGPTGLFEPIATLAIAERVRAMLVAQGATVIMTRTTDSAVALSDRPIMSRQANAEAFVSIHLNATPDGVNPYLLHGSTTYYFHPEAEPLARAVHAGLIREMGLRDLGVRYNTFAVTRLSWMPAILCEGAFVIIPDQEAALRTPEFQSAYARGIVDGLAAYFRTFAERP